MTDAKSFRRIVDPVVWAALFVWWGISFIPHFLPNGLDAAGTGLILLAANALALFKGLPINGFSTTVGVLALLWGILDMTKSVLHLPYKPPVFAILLIALGVILGGSALVRALRASGSSSAGS